MKVGFKTIQRFQEGGMMPPQEAPAEPEVPAGGGAPAEGEDPLMQIAQMAMQALQSQDCNAAMQVCEAFIQLVQQAQGGGAESGAPVPEEPVYRAGGRLVRKIKK